MYGTFSKAVPYISGKYLNGVNDATAQGTIQSLPVTTSTPGQGQQNVPGDRIVLDDATAKALSDTTVGTLFGGVYEYVQTLSSATANPARGAAAFFQIADIGAISTSYLVSSDANPTTAIPAYFAGVFLNAITKGNFGWIQIAGVASCLFDSAVTAATNGGTVSAKVSAAVASTFDVGVALATVTNAFVVGYAIGLPVISTVSKVGLTRNIVRW